MPFFIVAIAIVAIGLVGWLLWPEIVGLAKRLVGRA